MCLCEAYLKFGSFMLQRATVPHKQIFIIKIMRSYRCHAALGHLTVMLFLTDVRKLSFCYSHFFGQKVCNPPLPINKTKHFVHPWDASRYCPTQTLQRAMPDSNTQAPEINQVRLLLTCVPTLRLRHSQVFSHWVFATSPRRQVPLN